MSFKPLTLNKQVGWNNFPLKTFPVEECARACIPLGKTYFFSANEAKELEMIFQVRDMFSECGGLGQEKKRMLRKLSFKSITMCDKKRKIVLIFWQVVIDC